MNKSIYIPKRTKLYCNKNNNRISNDKIMIIEICYLIGCAFWTILVIIFKLYAQDVICSVIIFIPYILFFAGYKNCRYITIEDEDNYFVYNYLSVGLLIFLPLLSWMNSKDKKKVNNNMFMSLVIVALILTMLIMVDMWIKPEYLSVMKHIKSILNTISMVLLIYAIYLYYITNYWNHKIK